MNTKENAECVAAIQQARTVAESLGYRTHDTAGSLLPLAKPKRVGCAVGREGSFRLNVSKLRISAAAAQAMGCEYVVAVSGEAPDSETGVFKSIDGGRGWWAACSAETAEHLVRLAATRKLFLAAGSDGSAEAA